MKVFYQSNDVNSVIVRYSKVQLILNNNICLCGAVWFYLKKMVKSVGIGKI